jgi:hypothetical protein
MDSKEIYQTLEDRDNPDEVECNGPYKCTRKDAWLGQGYYFWDTFEDLAHWWGHQGYNGCYVICKSQLKYNKDDIFDLTIGGNTDHLLEFEEVAKILKNQYNNKGRNISIPFIINYMKSKLGNFNYRAIRACGINSINKDQNICASRYYFKDNYGAYIDCKPCIQICILDKRILGKNNFKIIYPETYREDYTI